MGGPYIAVHLRRKDFLSSHSEDVPSLQGAATQIHKALDTYGVHKVFVATDAPQNGKGLLYILLHFIMDGAAYIVVTLTGVD